MNKLTKWFKRKQYNKEFDILISLMLLHICSDTTSGLCRAINYAIEEYCKNNKCNERFVRKEIHRVITRDNFIAFVKDNGTRSEYTEVLARKRNNYNYWIDTSNRTIRIDFLISLKHYD